MVTVLTNSAFPLLRYKVGDVTDAPLQKPLQGFAILTSVVGRQNDLLRSRSGRPIHPMGVKHTLEKYPNIQRFRAYQDASGQLRVLFESVDGNSRIDTHDAAQRLRELLEGYPVVIEQVATLPRTSAGKHRWVVSELSDS